MPARPGTGRVAVGDRNREGIAALRRAERVDDVARGRGKVHEDCKERIGIRAVERGPRAEDVTAFREVQGQAERGPRHRSVAQVGVGARIEHIHRHAGRGEAAGEGNRARVGKAGGDAGVRTDCEVRGRSHRLIDGESAHGLRGRNGRGVVGVAHVLRRDRVAARRLGDRKLRRAAAEGHRAAVSRAVDQELHRTVWRRAAGGRDGGREGGRLAEADGRRTRRDGRRGRGLKDLDGLLGRGGRGLDVADVVGGDAVERVRVAGLAGESGRGVRGVGLPERVRPAVFGVIDVVKRDARAARVVLAGPGDGEAARRLGARQRADAAGRRDGVDRVEIGAVASELWSGSPRSNTTVAWALITVPVGSVALGRTM